MTGTTARGPEPADHWPADLHRDLLDGLNPYLDRDGGLRDIMLHADHADLTGTLGSHLDTQAGLAAIFPPPAAASSSRTPGQPGTAAAITDAAPEARIALRRNPVILAVILSDLTVRALTITGEAETLARDLDRELLRELAGDLALESARGHAQNLDRELDRARNLLNPDLTRGPNFERELARELTRALALCLDRAHARARGHDRDLLDHALDHARELLDRNLLVRHLDYALGLARDIASQTAQVVGDALGLRQVEGLAGVLLEGALDDFTVADLARTDLAGRDLTGIRWSDRGTTWPPGTDVDALRARSREVAAGVYVVTSPGEIGKTLHEAPA